MGERLFDIMKPFDPRDNGKIINAQIVFFGNSKAELRERDDLLEQPEWQWIASDITWVGEQYHILAKRIEPQPASDGGGE